MTRQNTEKKRTLSRLLVVLAALALLSFCFLGTTFGRYTTGANGTGTGNVALWEISITGDAVGATSTALDATMISPDITNAFSATSNNRVQNSGKILIATITNNSDVAADVSVALSSTTFRLRGTYGDGINAENWTTGAADATQWQVEQVLTVKLYWDNTETFTDGGEATGTMQLAAKEGEKSVYIFAEITWTSMDAYYANENVANAIDTWIGENVTDIVCNFSYTATQASELPAGN